jgi:hypothetical protein
VAFVPGHGCGNSAGFTPASLLTPNGNPETILILSYRLDIVNITFLRIMKAFLIFAKQGSPITWRPTIELISGISFCYFIGKGFIDQENI